MSALLKPVSSRRKVDEGCRCLRAMAHELGPGGRLPTIRELARELRISKATASNCLDDMEAQDVITRRQGSGIFVSPRIWHKSVGLVFGSNIFEFGCSPFYAMLVECCRQRAQSHSEQFSFYLDVPTAREAPMHRDLADALERKKLHGILLPNRRSVEQVRWLEAQGVPVVSMSSNPGEKNCVVTDYAELVRLGVSSLATQGCRRIGLIRAFSLSLPEGGAADVRAYRAMLAELGLPERAEWMGAMAEIDSADAAATRQTNEEQGYWAAMKMLAADRRALDGVVVEDDMVTRGVLAAARKLGLAVGTEFKIATHANQGSLALREHEAALTLLEVDPGEIVEAMFGMLERLMAGTAGAVEPVLIKPMIVRGWRGNKPMP